MRGDRYALYSEPDDNPRAYLLSEEELGVALFKADGIADLSPDGVRVVVYDSGFPLCAVGKYNTQPGLWQEAP